MYKQGHIVVPIGRSLKYVHYFLSTHKHIHFAREQQQSRVSSRVDGGSFTMGCGWARDNLNTKITNHLGGNLFHSIPFAKLTSSIEVFEH